MREEVIVPFGADRSSVRVPTRVRSTLVSASFQSLRARGHEEPYLELLPAELRETVVSVVPGVWMPIGVAVAHYRALDALPLTPPERLELGAQVSKRVQESILAVAARAAREAGVTPWTGFPMIHRLWDRLFDGGGIQVTRIGPKEARVEVIQCPLLAVPHFRMAFRGFVAAGVGLFTRKVYATELGRHATPTSVVWRFAWV